jgi:hypothetical protein
MKHVGFGYAFSSELTNIAVVGYFQYASVYVGGVSEQEILDVITVYALPSFEAENMADGFYASQTYKTHAAGRRPKKKIVPLFPEPLPNWRR